MLEVELRMKEFAESVLCNLLLSISNEVHLQGLSFDLPTLLDLNFKSEHLLSWDVSSVSGMSQASVFVSGRGVMLVLHTDIPADTFLIFVEEPEVALLVEALVWLSRAEGEWPPAFCLGIEHTSY